MKKFPDFVKISLNVCQRGLKLQNHPKEGRSNTELFQHNFFLLQQENYSTIFTSFISDADFASKICVFCPNKKIHNNFSGTV